LKSRRGLVAAGLAVAVVGSIGVASTLTAGAEQIPDAPAAASAGSAAPSSAPAEADDDSTPPTVLPWGSRPQRIKKGRAGASSRSLRGTAFDVAPADASGSIKPKPRFGPKGRTNRTTFLKSEKTAVLPPEPLAAGATAAANPSADVFYHYSVGSQPAETDGAYANLTISKPKLGDADYHPLAEVAVQSADGKQIVEVGWNVDRVVNGDDDPHLFVYRWVNREPSCYNACGFVQYSPNIKPGDTLKYDVTKKFGIQYFNGAWWVAFDSEWIGYYPESLWNDAGITFNRSGLVQIFGEVAATSDKPCTTQMGNGQPPVIYDEKAEAEGKELEKNPNAARIASVSYLNGPPVEMFIRSTSKVYATDAPSVRSFRYGGPDPTDKKSPCHVKPPKQ
jgi:hypothetical protein